MQTTNDMFETQKIRDEMTARLAEIIEAKSAEYHQCETRIENLTKIFKVIVAQAKGINKRNPHPFFLLSNFFKKKKREEIWSELRKCKNKKSKKRLRD